MKKIFIGIDFSKEKFDATMLLTVFNCWNYTYFR